MSDRIEKAAMASDETIEKAVEVVWECGPWTDQESLRIARALAEAGLLAPAPLSEEIETDQLMQFGGPVAVIERRRRWVTDWEAIE